jgi:DNA-binding transcriptional LysR family regulator
MQLQDLEIFEQLYQLCSINATAKALGFAQSNITARLQQLEAEFDVTFFQRSYHGLTPTQQGTQFYHYVQQTLAATAQIKAQLHPVPQQPTVIISELLFNRLVGAKKQFDLTHYRFQLLSSTAIHQLQRPTADLIVTYAQFQHPDYLAGAAHYLPAAFLTATEAPQTLPYLVNHDKNCPFRARTLQFLNHNFTKIQEIDAWASILDLVKSGQGQALLPSDLLQTTTLQMVHPHHRFRIPYRCYTRKS